MKVFKVIAPVVVSEIDSVRHCGIEKDPVEDVCLNHWRKLVKIPKQDYLHPPEQSGALPCLAQHNIGLPDYFVRHHSHFDYQ